MATLTITYVYWLVAVSIVISIVASYAAFSFAERVASTSAGKARYWLFAGAVAMGLGIWAMHYLGMLAVVLPVPVLYHVPTVILSLLLAVAASAVALWLVSQQKLRGRAYAIGSIIMGGAIGAMHYTGMAAMRTSAMHHYNYWIVALSIVVAVVFSWTALHIAFSLSKEDGENIPRRIGGAALMGNGIAAMHYTAMSAVSFMAADTKNSTRFTISATHIDLAAIILITAVVIFGALISAYVDRKTNRELLIANESLEAMQARLLEREKELRVAVAKLKELANRDGLTGVYNRRFFDEAIAAECRRAMRASYPISLLMVDIDYFKGINDRYGHLVGDDCLRRVAQGLAGSLRRTSDVVARYGGEEFAIILPNVSQKNAAVVAEILRRAIQDLGIENESSEVSEYLTLSIGACTREANDRQLPGEMIRAADEALYYAKQNGRNRVHLAA